VLTATTPQKATQRTSASAPLYKRAEQPFDNPVCAMADLNIQELQRNIKSLSLYVDQSLSLALYVDQYLHILVTRLTSRQVNLNY
jgi:hypothetical protein